MREVLIFWKISKTIIYLLIFLFPIFFLPWVSSVLDFNKQYLLFFLVFFALISWLINALISNKLEVNFTILNISVMILLFTVGLSTVFSLSRYGSFWGWPLVVSSSFLSLLALAIFYFLISNLFKKEEIPLLFLTLFLSGFLVSIFFLFQFFGKFILPFDFTKTNSFNTIGSVNSLAIFLSFLLILLIPSLFFVKKTFRFVLGIFGLFFLICLLFINFQSAWLVVLGGTTLLFSFGVFRLKEMDRNIFITLTMVILVISLFFVFFRFSLPGLPSFPPDILDQKTVIGIFKHLPIKDLILGTGPGTFVYVWSKYKPIEINQRESWMIRFIQAPSEFLDRAITTGILGVVAFLFLFGVSFKLVISVILKTAKSDKEIDEKIQPSIDFNLLRTDWFLLLGILSGFGGLFFGFLVFPNNLSLFLVFWLLLGFLSLFNEKRKTFSLTVSPAKGLIFSFCFVLILVFGLGFSILYVQKYLAEVKYFTGIRAWQKGNTVLALSEISKAKELNSKIDLYLRDFGQLNLIRLNEILSDPKLSKEDKLNQSRILIPLAFNSVNSSTNLEPKNAVNWIVLGFICRNIIGLVSDAQTCAIKSYQKAAELEPKNPYIYNELGLIYLTEADLSSQLLREEEKNENLKLAKENFEKAISLKFDYVPSHFQLAMISIREGKIDEAINQLELKKPFAFSDIGWAFQLGLLYYNKNEFDKAKTEFERAVSIDQNYSNARYFLGLIYDREGNKNLAIEQFEIIERFNPENAEVKKILSNLRAGKPALEGIIAGQPPIEEKVPEEIRK